MDLHELVKIHGGEGTLWSRSVAYMAEFLYSAWGHLFEGISPKAVLRFELYRSAIEKYVNSLLPPAKCFAVGSLKCFGTIDCNQLVSSCLDLLYFHFAYPSLRAAFCHLFR